VLAGRSKREVFLLNASGRNRVSGTISVSPQSAYEIQTFNRYVRPEGGAMAVVPDAQGILNIDAVVEPGGFLMVTRRN
jgi:hypothetical protein